MKNQEQPQGTGRLVWRKRGIYPQDRRYANPSLRREEKPKKPHIHRGVSYGVLFAALLTVCGLLLMSPLLSLDYTIVEGNAFISTQEVLAATENFASQKLFGLFPRTNYFLFPEEDAAVFLSTALTQHQAVEEVRVEKTFPSRVTVMLRERTPHVRYVNGGSSFLIDRSGIVASLAARDDEEATAGFAVLYDQSTRPLDVGAQAASSAVVDAMFTLEELFFDRTDIPVEFFYLPPAVCPQDLFPAPPPEETPEEAGDSNTNSDDTNGNTNTAEESSEDANANSNTAPEEVPGDASDLHDLLAEEECDLTQRALSTDEFRVKSTEDWEMYFRLSDSLDVQVSRLLRVLNEQHLDRSRLDYVDLRFGEQVIYK